MLPFPIYFDRKQQIITMLYAGQSKSQCKLLECKSKFHIEWKQSSPIMVKFNC